MFFRFSGTAFLIIGGLLLSPIPSFSEQASSSNYKVLANPESGFNLVAIKNLISKGDKYVAKNDLVKARKHFDKARVLNKQLLGFYRDLNGSFRGIDARIPREMDSKGREAQALLAKTNLRLANLFRRQNQPEVAVPLLVEVIRLMTPARAEGKQAYQALIELGFVETPYRSSRN